MSGELLFDTSTEDTYIFNKGKWECMDHERDVQYLNELWKNGKAFWK